MNSHFVAQIREKTFKECSLIFLISGCAHPFYTILLAGSMRQNESPKNKQNEQNESTKNALPDEYRRCKILGLWFRCSDLDPNLEGRKKWIFKIKALNAHLGDCFCFGDSYFWVSFWATIKLDQNNQSLTVKWQIYFKPYNQCLEILTWTVLVALGSQTLPREGSKGGGAHSSDEILRADTHVHSDDATYNNNTLKRPGEQGSNGQGMG